MEVAGFSNLNFSLGQNGGPSNVVMASTADPNPEGATSPPAPSQHAIDGNRDPVVGARSVITMDAHEHSIQSMV